MAQKLVQTSYEQVDLKALEVVSQPSVEGQLPELKEGNVFEFIIGVDVRPHVAVSGYKGIEVVYPQGKASDDELQSQLCRSDREDQHLKMLRY